MFGLEQRYTLGQMAMLPALHKTIKDRQMENFVSVILKTKELEENAVVEAMSQALEPH